MRGLSGSKVRRGLRGCWGLCSSCAACRGAACLSPSLVLNLRQPHHCPSTQVEVHKRAEGIEYAGGGGRGGGQAATMQASCLAFLLLPNLQKSCMTL